MTRGFNTASCFCAALLTLAARVELAQSPKSATATGFVTRVDSPNQFNIGSLTVHISPAAQCSAGNYRTKHFWYNRLLASEMFGSEGTGRTYKGQIDYSPQRCDQLKLTIGSWVRVEGKYAPSAYLTALAVIAFKQLGGTTTSSGAVLEENPGLGSGQSRAGVGELWLDGYPMIVDSQSDIRQASPGTTLEANKMGFYSFHAYHSRLNDLPTTQAEELKAGQCVTYTSAPQGTGALLAKSLVLWDCSQDRSADRYARDTSESSWTPPDYARGSPGTVQYFRKTLLRRGVPKGMVIPPDRILQDYVTRVGMSVLPDYAKETTDKNPGAMRFRFVLVDSLGRFAKFAHYLNGIGNHEYEDSIVPFPDGLIVVAADGGIANLKSEGQLAALLSIAETKILQRQAFLGLAIGGIDFEPPDIAAFGIWQEAQAIRIGIRQMYLAGYDIREAPFAWLVAQGKPVPNPTIGAGDSGSTVPWYSSYAFDYLSKYYSDVDYSKLKRGEAEYQQFLDELRKADPEAFTEK